MKESVQTRKSDPSKARDVHDRVWRSAGLGMGWELASLPWLPARETLRLVSERQLTLRLSSCKFTAPCTSFRLSCCKCNTSCTSFRLSWFKLMLT